MSQNRRLAAIMFTDIEGYTSLMQNDEEKAIHIRSRHREIFELFINKHDGELIQYYGDGTLSIFNSSIDAVNCAIEMQLEFQKNPIIPIRIGIHLGEIIKTESDIIGDAVNITSRLESLSNVGGILISNKVRDTVRNKKYIQTTFLGRFKFKNVNPAVPVYAISNDGIKVPNVEELKNKNKAKPIVKNVDRRRVLLAISILIVMALLFYYFKMDIDKKAETQPRSIAVLPFSNMSLDDDSELFTDGITEDILIQLSKINGLRVISRTSAMQFKNSNESIEDIAKKLDVSYILIGSVRKYENKVRINAQLINVSNNEYLWADNFDKTLVEIFEIQSQVSLEIANALKITLSAHEKSNINEVPTAVPKAYKNFKAAQMYLHRGGGKVEELKRAEKLFEEAISYDPEFSRAYVGLAETYLEYIFWGRESTNKMLELASKPALKALSLNANNGDAYGVLGAISYYKYEKETASRYLKKAIELNPSYVSAYNKLGWIYTFEGNMAKMEENFNQVLKLDPLSSKYIGDMAQAYYYLQEFQKGFDLTNGALEKFPDNDMILWMKASMLTGLGKYDEAIKLYSSRSVASNTNWMLGYSYGMNGNQVKAREILNYQLEKNKLVFVPAYMIATIYMGLGESEKALDWLEKDFDFGGQGLFFWGLKNDVKFESLKNEPRFQQLLKTID